MKWRLKILIMCLTCTLGALILQTVLFQNISSRLLTARAREETVGMLQNLQNSVYSYLNTMEGKMIKIYEEDGFLSDLNSSYNVAQMKQKYLSLARDFTLSAFETDDGVRALYLYDADHRVISTYRRTVTPKHNYPTDIYSDPQYNGQAVLAYMESDQRGVLVSSYYNSYREKEIVRLVMKIFAPYRYDRPLGYIVCDVDSDTIAALMKKSVADPEMLVWLQPSSDRVAVSIGTLSREQTQTYQQITEWIGQESVTEEELEALADTGLFRMEQSRYDLTAYSLMSQELLLQHQNALSLSVASIAGIMILVAVVVTSLGLRSMTRPLDRLTHTMEQIRDGRTQLRAAVDREDELGILARNFNEMLDHMEILRLKEQEHIRLLDQAEYRALQAQINPHFLYNTLETMAAIADMESCPEVSRLSVSLSRIFRYSLNTRDAFSTVETELEHLKNYTYIMNVRMHDEVEYRVDVDPSVRSAPIPRLSIQPLVENALNHGLKNKAGKKIVVIAGKRVGDDLVLTVSDNGVGMDAEAMNRSLAHPELCTAADGSIGLHNINARLKLLHGEAYGLRLDSIFGEGTRVTMTIPQKERGTENEKNL